MGVNDDLPEGVFGIMDDITPLYRLERLHDTSWEDDHRKRADKRSRAKKAKKRRKRKVALDGMSVPQLHLNEKNYASSVPNLEYENMVSVPEDLLRKVTAKSTMRTRDLSQLMLSRLLPSMMGLEAAQSFVTTALRDGLGIEVEMDDAVMEASKVMSNLDLVFYFMRRSALPKKLKHKFMDTLIEQVAKDTAETMKTVSVRKEKTKAQAELQAMIVRGMSQAHKNEDLSRRTNRPRREEEDESPIGLVDDAPSRTGPGMRRSRRDPRMR